MGLFDGLRQRPTVSFTKEQAFMTIVLAAVKSDGHVSDDEVRRVRALCSVNPMFASNSRAEDDAILDFADNVTHQLGEEAIAKAAAVLPAGVRETAFAYACDMVLADGVVTEHEENFITALASRLGVTEDVARAVVTTTLIRNRAE